jgi:hypothetical protein
LFAESGIRPEPDPNSKPCPEDVVVKSSALWQNFLCRRSTAAALLLAATASSPATAADEVQRLITNSYRFEIPFEVDVDAGEEPNSQAILYKSQNGGKTWEREQTAPASKGAFVFTAPRDGIYSFAIRMTDASGTLLAPIEGSPPELEIQVDRSEPIVKLELLEESERMLTINWSTDDPGAVPESLLIELTDVSSGVRTRLKTEPAVAGTTTVPFPDSGAVQVRASIVDAAGNKGEARRKLESDYEQPAESPDNKSPYAKPSEEPAEQPAATPEPEPAPEPMPATRTAPRTRPAPVIPQQPEPPAATPAPESKPLPGPIATRPPEIPPATPPQPVDADYGNPAESPLMVNNRVFDIEYQVDDVGPSGISAVDLFVTEDNGRQWFRYGTDADRKSPFSVDAMAEGTFGFAVRVRNGVGVSEIPPQPGDPPEIIITVDQTAPAIEMAQPDVRSEGQGSVRFAWRIRETHPAPNSVRLEYAAAAAGPWTPVFDWQPNRNSYEMALRPGMPPAVYFRLTARDQAGNLAAAQTPQPVVVDLKKPTARLIRVQPVQVQQP